MIGVSGLGMLLLAACAHAPPAASPLALAGTDGVTRTYPELVQGAPATLLVFFSRECRCMEAHDARLRSLAESISAAGVRVFAVDSEFGATLEGDRAEAAKRGYAFPMLLDPDARLAAAVGADFATFSAVFDATGTQRYSGGFDSVHGAEHEDTQPWVKLAIADVLAGRPVAHPQAKTLGCALKRW